MDDNFEQKIKKVLNGPPDFPIDEKAWENLQNRMQETPEKGRGMMAYLVPLALLLWLVPVAFSWHANMKLNDASNKIEHLETLLQSDAILLLDTIVQRQVTVVYDTIYRAVYVDENIKKNTVNNTPQPFNKPSFSFLYKNENRYFNEPNVVPVNSLFSMRDHLSMPLFGLRKNADIIKTGNVSTKESIKSGPLLNVEQLALMPLEINNDPDLSTVPTPFVLNKIKKKKGLRYYMYKMQPARFSLGIGYGLVNVAGFGADNSAVGLDAAIGYGKNINLIIGAEYLPWKFKKEFEEEEEDEMLEGFPEVRPSSLGDELHELYGDFKYIQIPVGLEYIFNSKKRVSPYIGLGVTAQKTLRSRLAYEFNTPLNDEYELQKNNVLPNAFELKSIWGSFGVQYKFGDHWNFHLEGNAQFDLEKGKYKYEGLQIYKFKGGLGYRF